jgi:hypothetical protein
MQINPINPHDAFASELQTAAGGPNNSQSIRTIAIRTTRNPHSEIRNVLGGTGFEPVTAGV